MKPPFPLRPVGDPFIWIPASDHDDASKFRKRMLERRLALQGPPVQLADNVQPMPNVRRRKP